MAIRMNEGRRRFCRTFVFIRFAKGFALTMIRRRQPSVYKYGTLVLVVVCLKVLASAVVVVQGFVVSVVSQQRPSCSSDPLIVLMAHRQQQQQHEAKDAVVMEEDGYQRELFSVAPMMGHTNRHFRYFYRLFSKRAHLYTEMVPSEQILRAYRRARSIYLGVVDNVDDDDLTSILEPEEMFQVISLMKSDPGREYRLHGTEHTVGRSLLLSELIGMSTSPGDQGHDGPGPVVLQLGGRHPDILEAASAIAVAFHAAPYTYTYGHGHGYTDINLNCGCPSNGMVGHSGGAALMRDPDLVARCVDAMHKGVASVADYYVGTSSSDHRPRMRPTISVKHRLGVRDAATFDGAADRMKNDEDSYEECRSFVETVALSGAVTKFHVHGRLGLLGEFSPQDKTTKSKRQEQERSARQQTIKNRDVPPLRPDVVQRLAYEFPHLEFVANGGIQTLSDVDRLVNVNTAGSNKSRVVGAMVGRAAINHPCAFASADRLWEKQATTIRRPTRGEVLQEYIEYCDREEDRIVAFGASKKMVDELRRRLVAAPFHLTMGEDGNEAFQRRVKKLTSKTVMLKASSILSGAASFLPASTLGKCVDDFVPWEDIAQYEDSCRRSGAMQRMIS